MAKNSGKPNLFGTRKGVGTATVIRNKQAKITAQNEQWVSEISRLADESAGMIASATIVTAYHKQYADRLTEEEKAVLNGNMTTLVNVVSSHKEAVEEIRAGINEMKEKISGGAKSKTASINVITGFMDLATRTQDTMNDFANVGLSAIDECLGTFRVLAERDQEVPAPKYMSPKEGQPAYHDDATKREEIVVIDSLAQVEAMKEKSENQVH